MKASRNASERIVQRKRKEDKKKKKWELYTNTSIAPGGFELPKVVAISFMQKINDGSRTPKDSTDLVFYATHSVLNYNFHRNLR